MLRNLGLVFRGKAWRTSCGRIFCLHGNARGKSPRAPAISETGSAAFAVDQASEGLLHINLSGPNHSAVADPVRGLLDSREKKQPAQDKNKRPSSIEKKPKKKKQDREKKN